MGGGLATCRMSSVNRTCESRYAKHFLPATIPMDGLERKGREMQIARFKEILAELRETSPFPASVQEFAVFRRFDRRWFDESDIVVEDKKLSQDLHRTLSLVQNWRARNSRRTFFPMRDCEAVLVATSVTPPRKPTRDACAQSISSCIQHATDWFDASHDTLTGVLNAKSIDAALLDNVAKAVLAAGNKHEAVAALSEPSQVAVISLDLDHFKQVNDSYGHEYGDLVLMCFAQRIEDKVGKLQREYKGTSLAFGRSGGEEFLVVLGGIIEEKAIHTIAEAIRRSVSEEVLPTDEEWRLIPAERKPEGMDLPHVTERKVTASVGVSSVVVPQAKTDKRGVCATLRREADAAMYRAKAGGRNVVRYFPAIRNSHGTVLEHHQDTGVVVIDIGTNVNVQPGHEFVVFHPDFTGEIPFIQSDGRSRKRLGSYPRHPSGRLIVFDAQKEVSFCTVEEIKELRKFPIGSALEFIPMGSIGHLIERGGGQYALNASRLREPVELEKEVKRAAEDKREITVAVFNLLNPEEVESSRGTAFTNRALAAFLKEIDSTFPLPASISQIAPTMLAVVLLGDKPADAPALSQALIERCTTLCVGLVRFGVGFYLDGKSELNGDASELDPQFALDYARYAASAHVLVGDQTVEVFSPTTAVSLTSRLRSLHRHSEVVSDYCRFREIGVDYGELHNVAALCYFEAADPDVEAALAAISRACELDPEQPWFIANRAVIEFAHGDRLAAHRSFSRIGQTFDTTTLPNVYHSCRAVAAYEQFKVDPSQVSGKVVLSWLRVATSKQRGDFVISRADVEKALNEMTSALKARSNHADSSASQ
jgi:diguanylate cyclase (GGDEF)-like protein